MNKEIKTDPNTSSFHQYATYICRAEVHFLLGEKLAHTYVACLDSLMADD